MNTNKDEITQSVDIAVVGGGIGGAAAAIALQQAGFTVDVYEQATELREIGGAIVIRDPSLALFHAWGFGPRFKTFAVPVHQLETRDKDGVFEAMLSATVDASEGKWAYSVHRADIHSMLVSAIPAHHVHLGHHLESITRGEAFADAHFKNGARVRARIIIGADGLRSVTRSLMDTTAMTFMGQLTHRTVTPASVLPADMPNDRLRMWKSDKRIVIFLPVHGGRDFAIDAIVRQDEPPAELWSSVPVDTLLRTYEDFDPLIARALKARSVDVTTHPVYDKAPLARWVSGRVVLLGDAAHPMAPMQGQGANSAIQDAGALADLLRGTSDADVAHALHAYEQQRAPVTAELQARSRLSPNARQK